MKKSVILLVSFVSMTLMSSCKSTFLLRENFSGDGVNSLPLKNIPDNPDGDSVSYTPVINPRLSIQASGTDPADKSLVFSEAPVSGATAFNQWLSFKGVVSDYNQPIWFQWSGKQRNSHGTLMIDIQGVKRLWIARLEILPNGQLRRITNIPTGDGELLGTFNPDQPHTIIISLQPAALTYAISVFGTAEGSASNRTNIPVVSTPSSDGPVLSFERPSINFRYQNESFIASSAYIIEEVFITRQEPKK